MTLVWTALAALIAVLLWAALRHAFRLPSPDHGNTDPPIPGEASALARKVADMCLLHPGKSGFLILDDPVDALASRIAHVRAASTAIDAQYYIWKGDMAGRMLLAELVEAAQRGVRVRLLLDDIPTAGLDAVWAAADSLPNFEVRLFNPLAIRKPRFLNYLFNPARLNRRMHNKSMTFDHCVSIIGGRNIGDEYFGARERGLFIDLDALAVGEVVADIAVDFARYWSSGSAYPARQILPPPDPGEVRRIARAPAGVTALAAEYAEAMADAQGEALAWQAADRLSWAPARLYSDNPAKALDRSERRDLVAVRILPVIAAARERVDLVSGYFVPGRFGTRLFTRLARRGVNVRIVTNSARVTDKRFVHAGYVPYRRALLRAGARLFEACPRDRQRKPLRERLRRRRPEETGRTRFSGGGESVHAKTCTVDGRYLFVGSFNFDPRSAMLNCEIGFIIDSPPLAQAVNDALDEHVLEAAYAVTMSKLGLLRWELGSGEDVRVFEHEPDTTIRDRLLVVLYRVLPLEWLL